jgi:hypothetical protein
MSRPNLYPVRLSPEQRQRLEDLRHNGHAPVKKITHATVLLLADKDHPEGRYNDVHIGQVLGLHINSVARIRKLFVLHGEAPALERKERATPPTPRKVDGHLEAQLVALCCSEAPEGRVRWTLDLLVREVTKRGYVTTICRETIRRALKKTSFNLGGSSVGACPRRIGPAS